MYHAQIAAHFRDGRESWSEVDWRRVKDDYAYRYLALHLKEVRDNAGLFALIGKPWMTAQYERTQSQWAFSADVEHALAAAAAESPANLVQVVRLCLIYATLGSLASGVPPEALGVLAELEEAERAREFAGLIPDPARRGNAYRLIAEALLASGGAVAAMPVLEHALAEAKRIREDPEEHSKGDLLAGVGLALACAGVPDRALAALAAMPDHQVARKAEALGKLMLALTDLGADDQALAAAMAIRLEGARTANLITLARTLARADRVDRALAVVAEIQPTDSQVGALREIARTLAERGLKERIAEIAGQALAMAARSGGDSFRADALAQIAWPLAEAGQARRVAEVAGEIIAAAGEAGPSPPVLGALALALAQAGEKARASELVHQALDRMNSPGPDAPSTAAVALGRAGDLDGALAAVAQIVAEDDRAVALGRTTLALVESGRIDQAVAVAQRIDAPAVKTYALAAVALGFARAGNAVAAHELTRQAGAVAQAIDDRQARSNANTALTQAMTLGRQGEAARGEDVAAWMALAEAALMGSRGTDEVMSRLAQTLARLGEAERRLDVAFAIPSPWVQVDALTLLLLDPSQEGRVDQGLTRLEAVQDRWVRVHVLARLARFLPALGQAERAAEAAERAMAAGTERVDGDTLLDVAVAMARTGEAQRVLSAVDALGRDRDQSVALQQAAEDLAQAGKVDQALAVAAGIAEDSDRVETLRRVIEILLQSVSPERASEVAQQLLAIGEGARPAAYAAVGSVGAARILIRSGQRGRAEVIIRGLVESVKPAGGARAKVAALLSAARQLAWSGREDRAVDVTYRASESLPSIETHEHQALR